MPTRLVGELRLGSIDDYRQFLPDGLPPRFTRKEYMKLIKSRSRYDGVCLKLLESLGIIRHAGKEGRAHVYECI